MNEWLGMNATASGEEHCRLCSLTGTMFVRWLSVLVLGILMLPVWSAETAVNPAIKTAADGFPAGAATPEGAACDFIRALIQHDAALYLATCLKPYGGDEVKKTYGDFLGSVVAGLNQDAKKGAPSPDDLKNFDKCYAARHLSRNGPASYGSASFGFKDVVFVDVSVGLQSGRTRLNRTLVIQEKSGQWAVHPRPDLSPLLSIGLSAEDRSVREFSETSTTASPSVAAVPSATPAPYSPDRHAQLSEIYRRITAEIEAKATSNPRMRELHERFGRTPGPAVELKMTNLGLALLDLADTDQDAKAIVDRFQMLRNKPPK